jgi:hypothetical protein
MCTTCVIYVLHDGLWMHAQIRPLNCGNNLGASFDQGWAGPGRPVWMLSDARSRFGGLCARDHVLIGGFFE